MSQPKDDINGWRRYSSQLRASQRSEVNSPIFLRFGSHTIRCHFLVVAMMHGLKLLKKRETTNSNRPQEDLIEYGVRIVHSSEDPPTEIKKIGSYERRPSRRCKLSKRVSSMSMIRGMRSCCCDTLKTCYTQSRQIHCSTASLSSQFRSDMAK
ncbi:hypothetical protein M405DRAFT_44613 [Rhizopogon salebrosus TDB-379]|nr:hypothetical protein M405DRAFT_44613 [Rhizopogon salebrosus TDB-379]